MSSLTPPSPLGYRIDQPTVGPIPSAAKGQDRQSTFRAEAGFVQRIDASHEVAESDVVGPAERIGSAAGMTAEQRDQWLRLHANDLIQQLQLWSLDLDARQAQLNAASASHDLRERQIRIRQQAIDDGLQHQQVELDAITREVKAQARRLAFQFD